MIFAGGISAIKANADFDAFVGGSTVFAVVQRLLLISIVYILPSVISVTHSGIIKLFGYKALSIFFHC